MHFVPLFVAHARQKRIARNAGVVDENIEPAPFFGDRFDEFLHGAAVGDIAGKRFGLTAGGSDGRNGFGKFCGIARDASNLRFAAAQRQRNRFADAAQGAGDKGNLAGQIDG